MAPLTPSHALPIDPQIWKALAGPSSLPLPLPNSIVYYFPQGHSQYSDQSPLPFSNLVYSNPSIRCQVLSVEHLGRSDTDEILAKIRLKPICKDDDNRNDQAPGKEARGAVTSFAKVLTPSDANNGGGFSMPKAFEELFPKLDMKADPPVQNLTMLDIQGKEWEFRHIFRGKPLRNLLTTGWSKFVNAKKLIRGDSVVFIRDERSNCLHIGVRRARINNNDDNDNNVVPWMNMNLELTVAEEMEVDFGNSFSREALGKVPKEEVIEAAEKAVSGEQFEIVYYPEGGFGNFVVNAELIERTLKYPWRLDLRVKMHMEMGEPPRAGMVKGRVVALSGYDKSGLWDAKSPWRKLKIMWDDPKVSKDYEWVSPWELQIDDPLKDALSIQPFVTKITSESMSNIVAAPPRFIMNLSQNTHFVRPGGNRLATRVPILGSMVQAEVANGVVNVSAAQNESMNSAPAIQGNNARNIGTLKLFGKIITYERKSDGNGST